MWGWEVKPALLIYFLFPNFTSSAAPLGRSMWTCECNCYCCFWLKEEVWHPHRPLYNIMSTLLAGVCSTCWKRDVVLSPEEETERCECHTQGLARTHLCFLKGHTLWQETTLLREKNHWKHHFCCSLSDAVEADWSSSLMVSRVDNMTPCSCLAPPRCLWSHKSPGQSALRGDTLCKHKPKSSLLLKRPTRGPHGTSRVRVRVDRRQDRASTMTLLWTSTHHTQRYTQQRVKRKGGMS